MCALPRIRIDLERAWPPRTRGRKLRAGAAPSRTHDGVGVSHAACPTRSRHPPRLPSGNARGRSSADVVTAHPVEPPLQVEVIGARIVRMVPGQPTGLRFRERELQLVHDVLRDASCTPSTSAMSRL